MGVWGMSFVQKFARDCNGNAAMIFGITALPLLLASGAAIDLVQTNRSQTILQGAADAAALAGASSGKTDDKDIEVIANKFLAANGTREAVEKITNVEIDRDETKNTVSVLIRGLRPTSLMHLIGVKDVEIEAYAEVSMPADGLEVALVLDVTHSMNSDGRLPALKSAANDFVDTMMNAKASGADVKVGIVPFANYVNVGMAVRNEPWMSVPNDTSVTLPEQCSIQYPQRQWTNCTEVQKTGVNDGIPYTYTAYENCTVIDGPAQNVCYTPVNESKWHGCVGSRSGGLDEEIGNLSTPYPGIMGITCNDEITRLTDDGSKLKAKINGIVASQETYMPSGLLWGWNMVDGDEPLSEAQSAAAIKAKGGTKAIVLMTDGDNTKSANYPYHGGSDGDLADAKVKELCKNIKNDDIVIYTISFMVTDSNTTKMLEKCATDGSKAFTAESAAQLAKVFDDIGNSMLAMRLTK
jgi:Flp pilus assembly protein TadG